MVFLEKNFVNVGDPKGQKKKRMTLKKKNNEMDLGRNE